MSHLLSGALKSSRPRSARRTSDCVCYRILSDTLPSRRQARWLLRPCKSSLSLSIYLSFYSFWSGADKPRCHQQTENVSHLYGHLYCLRNNHLLLYIPETKGRPVEEMGVLFHDEVADGQGIVKQPEAVHLEVLEAAGGDGKVLDRQD